MTLNALLNVYATENVSHIVVHIVIMIVVWMDLVVGYVRQMDLVDMIVHTNRIVFVTIIVLIIVLTIIHIAHFIWKLVNHIVQRKDNIRVSAIPGIVTVMGM